MNRIIGAGFAGRDAVIGPLPCSTVSINCENGRQLENLIGNDYSNFKRTHLLKHIDDLIETKIITEIPVSAFTKESNMNELIFNEFNMHLTKYQISSTDNVFINKVGRNRYKELNYYPKEILSTLNIVTAKCHIATYIATLYAKKRFKESIQSIKEQYECDFGSGSPSDPLTRLFLKIFYEGDEEFIPEARKNWRTLDSIRKEVYLEKKKKKTNSDFFISKSI